MALAIVHVLLSRELFDHEFLVRYSNAPWLVYEARARWLFLRGADNQPLVWDQTSETFISGMQPDIAPALFGAFTKHGRPVKTVMSLVAERYLDERYSPANVADECGVPAETIERLALEMAHVAFEQSIEVEARWTDWYGRTHDKFVGRPVAMYAMRGISAHSNGFQSCRAIHLVQLLLGALYGPGNFRARAPFPKPIPPHQLPENNLDIINAPNTPLSLTPRMPRLVLKTLPSLPRLNPFASYTGVFMARHPALHTDAHGHRQCSGRRPLSDRHADSVHGQHGVEFEHEHGVGASLAPVKDANGDYKIPFLVVADAFHSETVNFADLVIPDTTYLERHDVISLLDRPISEPDSAADAIRYRSFRSIAMCGHGRTCWSNSHRG